MLRHLFSAAVSLVATSVIFGTVVFMNLSAHAPPKANVHKEVSFDIPPPERKPPKRKPKPKPKPRKQMKRAAPPTPMIAAGVGGLDLGLSGFGSTDLGDATAALLGDTSNVVMNAETVDQLPIPMGATAVPFPPEARKAGITGKVVMSVLIGVDGRVEDVTVSSATPPGVFENAAMQAVRTWRFQPAMYQGAPVRGRFDQTINFTLER